MALADPSDWGTLAWAAETLGVSERQVRRYVRDKQLTAYRPRIGTRETSRRFPMLSVAQVQDLARARALGNVDA